ncbi:protease inhibitor I9 family protein [Sporosarcina aquimarina]|uniref:Protease inhibitor I9 family protein n=1 Tax=Sporosarcina aquimarina TaxID=114975 RepID=A0ABU4FUK7_9BACL|nr:protease inhibitor I9 family protein [Sporosarcina aquimarina]MDW0108433.1 protease inhibitor I9 family protein [Sporosarcina aquimarina]
MIYIDPNVDLHTKEFVQIIIEFRISPAHVAIIKNPLLSLEKATEQVEQSHRDFLEELNKFLGEKQYPYAIIESYKRSFNGVALELRGMTVQKLLSSRLIKAIYVNREIRIPETPIM